PHPFVYPRVEGEGVFDVPVGPIHAGVIEPGHFVFSGAGERILKLEARLFFTHRGIEKLAEGQPVAQGVFVAERICGVCAFSHSTAYVQAVEALAGTPAPPRAQAIRTLLLEFERLYNHIGDVGNICAGIGFAPGSSAGARLKERLQELNEVVTGHRFLRGINCVGGVRRELTNLPHAAAQLRVIKTEFAQMVDVMLNSDSVRQRLDGTGVLAAAVAEAFGAVGVAARASGSRRDSRIYHPHGLYPALAVQATTRQQGDVRARTEVRIQEAQQAFRLVAEVLDRLPDGPLTVPLGPLPAYHGALGRVESPRGETAHWVMVAPDGTIYRYRVRSAPYANWPVVPFAVPGNMVPDFPLINKSFELCYACCDR
ncbi:MAG TPA: nickel-dependent hydrogenase large subunit, partial [Chloroflexia bacterium]|nr:nickel-dependent hydrogenase large subunit [Chloroflexia bacterium]